ncbi:oxygen-independent coproporphyrinogen III oxidase [Cyclobacterium sediminis]
MTNPSLIQKYNVPAPRYTSYPTVPHWENDVHSSNWAALFTKAYKNFGPDEGISLYIHLPYCESLCTYCGCNKRITKNHNVELPYITAVMKEWDMYVDLLDEKPKLAGIHLGGGTPTFFSPSSLWILIDHITKNSSQMGNYEFSFEGHPNNTSKEHLETLAGLGFDRVSFGIQDFDCKVQRAIHRFQPYEKVKQVTEASRKSGYKSINFDLIYGLPHQTLETLKDTFEKTKALMPDRIAFYSYAHLPTVFPAQKSFEEHLPNEEEKRKLYEQGKIWLKDMGYEEIGMDHFALIGDPLLEAKSNRTLHRNFMGYTTSPSKILLGLGCSAISDINYAYGQNEKKIEAYTKTIWENEFPIIKGHIQKESDLRSKSFIMSLICNHTAPWKQGSEIPDHLLTFLNEGLISFDKGKINITEEGKPFVRNICMALDPYSQNTEKSSPVFSKAI